MPNQFLSTLSLRRATISIVLSIQPTKFLSTLSLRRATKITITVDEGTLISIHALLAESDLRVLETTRNCYTDFYPRSPCGERRPFRYAVSFSAGNFYPRSPCGERPACLKLLVTATPISIHALLAESDASTTTTIICIAQFLSTLSLRRATSISSIINNVIDNFYPRSPCGERRISSIINNVIDNFYPRSPCGERQ